MLSVRIPCAKRPTRVLATHLAAWPSLTAALPENIRRVVRRPDVHDACNTSCLIQRLTIEQMLTNRPIQSFHDLFLNDFVDNRLRSIDSTG